MLTVEELSPRNASIEGPMLFDLESFTATSEQSVANVKGTHLLTHEARRFRSACIWRDAIGRNA